MGCFGRLVLLLLSVMFIMPTATAPPEETGCPEVVRIAMATTDQACADIGLNQACYGHVLVEARPRPTAEQFTFSQEGDTANLLDLETLRLSSMDLESGLWGVALMNLQAYMPYSSPEEVTFLLFGDIAIENQVAPMVSVPVTVTARAYVNVRLGPSVRAGAIGVLAPGQTVMAQGRLADSSWIRVVMPDTGRVGWLSGDLITSAADLDTLAVVEARAPYYGPMQAVYLRTGVDDSLCPEAPESGILIQTPEGVAEVTLLVNEVNVQLSNATAFVQAQPGGALTVNALDGWVQVESNGVQQQVFPGSQVSVALNEHMAPSAPPSLPQPMDDMGAIPVQFLDHPIEIPEPLSPAAIASLLNGGTAATPTEEATQAEDLMATPAPSEEGAVETSAEPPPPPPSEPASSGPSGPPPGLGGVLPPGQGGTPPGQGGTPPGQAR